MALGVLRPDHMRLLSLMPILAGCSAVEPPAPTSGQHLRLVLDDMTLPRSAADIAAAAINFTHDGRPYEDELGVWLEALAKGGSDDAPDDASIRRMIGEGRVPSLIDVFDGGGLEPGDIVGVSYSGTPEAAASVLRASVTSDHGFATIGMQAASPTVLVPAFVDADPTPVQLDYAELELEPDGVGAYGVRIQGMAEPDPLATAVCTGLIQMITADPSDHPELNTVIDTNQDGTISVDECRESSIIQSLTAPDVTGPNHRVYCSFAIAAHVVTPPSVPPAEPRSP
jgi:hypothetical protein